MPAATSLEDAYHQGGNSLMERQFARHQPSQEHYLAMFMDQFEIMKSSPAVAVAAAATINNKPAAASKPILASSLELGQLKQKHWKSFEEFDSANDDELEFEDNNSSSRDEEFGERSSSLDFQTINIEQRTYQRCQQQTTLNNKQPYLTNYHHYNKHSNCNNTKQTTTTPQVVVTAKADDGDLFAQFEPLDLEAANNCYYLRMSPPSGHEQAHKKSNNNNNNNNNNNHHHHHHYLQQQQQQQHYLTLEELKIARNSCWLCGCNWQEDHVSLDCLECGGYALSRPCPSCDGQCNQVWQRNITGTHDHHKALWTGKCGKQRQQHEPEGTSGGVEASTIKGPQQLQPQQQQQQIKLAPSSCCSSQPSSAASSDSELGSGKATEGADSNCVDQIATATTKQQHSTTTTTNKTASDSKSGKQPKHYQKQLCVCN